MRPTAPLILSAALAITATSLTACGAFGNDPNTLKVVYLRNTDNKVRHMDHYLSMVKKQFEREHRGKKVKLIPIQAAQPDYWVKIQQMMRSSKTAPDVVYEDTFIINSDVASGYLRPLDRYLRTWRDWDAFLPQARTAAKAEDGKTYGVPIGTDTRGLWFNKKVFATAGLPTNWQPKTWDELLTAARTIKKKVPGVIPLNVYTGKGPGEASVMQGFEMLLYGTGADPLYDPKAKKWIAGGQGFKDALGFLKTVYGERLGPHPSDAVDPNVTTRVATELLPEGKVAIALDGSWMGQFWRETGGRPWPEWSRALGQAPMPTQYGDPPGKVSMSGGWTWAIPAKSEKPDLAWKLIETLQTQPNAVEWTLRDAQIAVREDVATDRRYLTSMPGIRFFTDLVRHTHYRPALPVYPRVSSAIGEAMEAVTTSGTSAASAAKDYDKELRSIADGKVVNRSR
ncbi:extracellular solute-binding protein [Streptomyces zagrosensis]|uniref:Multiple sugar transport system substrate-binding protein n=1 Tax=Streptomyces zagrosensis TaxID=1042984 RepID=A0A7W9Q8Y9_9ACTN|nr:extracellular solute-binding protein [Streptomyces zagrosensis]MBB5935825.1 multiple sugar transport system substrate-binding protein [Streptomyces zagrosensis]